MRRLAFWVILSMSLLQVHGATAYSYKRHREINKLAVKNIVNLHGTDVSAHLERTVGLGLDSPLSNFRPEQFIAEGGPGEDEPFTRCLNHFHDPTEETTDGGLPWMPGVSAIQWALNYDGVQDGAWGGDHSWPAARRYFLKGLTGHEYDADLHQYVQTAATAAEREEALADSFRAIGQVMHLVADMSVPAHVRSDPHPPWDKDPYEVWAEDHFDKGADRLDEAIAGGLRIVTPELLGSPGIVPLFDADRTANSSATDPRQIFQGAPVGLSEFTNANFVSSDTLFRGYAFPTTWFLQVPHLRPAGTAVADYWGYPLTEVDGTGSPLVVDRFVRATYLGSLLGPQNSMSITYNPDIALTLDDGCLEATPASSSPGRWPTRRERSSTSSATNWRSRCRGVRPAAGSPTGSSDREPRARTTPGSRPTKPREPC